MTYYWRASRNGHDYADTTGAVLSPVLSPSGELAYKRQTDGAAIIPDRLYAFPGEVIPTWGIAPCAWGDDGTLYILNTPIGILLVIAPDGSRRTFDMNPLYPGLLPAALGLHHINAQGVPILPNDPSVAHLVIHGVECWDIDRDDDGTIVCLGDGGAADGKGSVNLIKPDGTVLMWLPPHDILTPPFISGGRVAISGFDTPEPGAVPWVPFQKFAPVDPVVTLPVFAPALRGSFGSPNIPGSNVGGTGHPMHVIEGPDDITAEDEKRLLGVVFDPFYTFDQAKIAADREKCIAICKRTGAALCIFDDGHEIEDILKSFNPPYTTIGLVHLRSQYPNGHVAYSPSYDAMVPMLVVSAIYPSAAWTPQEQAAQLVENQGYTDTHTSNVPGELFVGIGRNPPAWARAYAIDACKATPAPDLALWPRTVIPPPQKPPQPPVDHVKPGPKPVPKPKPKHPRWKFWK